LTPNKEPVKKYKQRITLRAYKNLQTVQKKEKEKSKATKDKIIKIKEMQMSIKDDSIVEYYENE